MVFTVRIGNTSSFSTSKKATGYHVLMRDMRLRYRDGRLAEIGKTLSVEGAEAIRPRRYGLHGAPTAWDAIVCSPEGYSSYVLTFCDYTDVVTGSTNVFAGKTRTIRWVVHPEILRRVLFLFVLNIANDYWGIYLNAPRPWISDTSEVMQRFISAGMAWLNGEEYRFEEPYRTKLFDAAWRLTTDEWGLALGVLKTAFVSFTLTQKKQQELIDRLEQWLDACKQFEVDWEIPEE